jgi:hypothetical protein
VIVNYCWAWQVRTNVHRTISGGRSPKYAAVVRAADRWRGISIGEFEQRQLRAIRDELSRAHVKRVAPAVTPKSATPVRELRADR